MDTLDATDPWYPVRQSDNKIHQSIPNILYNTDTLQQCKVWNGKGEIWGVFCELFGEKLPRDI